MILAIVQFIRAACGVQIHGARQAPRQTDSVLVHRSEGDACFAIHHVPLLKAALLEQDRGARRISWSSDAVPVHQARQSTR